MSDNYTVPLEKDFQKKVLKRLREIPGTWWLKVNDRATVGIPDILGCVAGVFMAIELKTKSKVTPIQAYTLRRIERADGQTFVVHPGNWAEVLKFIMKLAELRKPPEKQL